VPKGQGWTKSLQETSIRLYTRHELNETQQDSDDSGLREKDINYDDCNLKISWLGL